MKNLTLLLIGLLVTGTSCSDMKPTEEVKKLPVRWPHAVTYEVFVQSYCDSNGDGIGDFNGLTSKLDYIADLGVEAIWLMPINPSPSYHKYDVTDYYGIHPDYGTLEDFRLFVKEAHARDLKIIMDLVINHCSSKHPWFLDALHPEGEYRDYFVWADLPTIEAENALEKAATGDSDNTRQWNEVPGQDELYYAFFYSGMPDLNYDNPKVREEVYNIGKFWLTDVGIDGFRLDAAKHIYPDHRAEDNHAFWKEFKEKMESYKPDAYMVGEVWADLETQAPFAQGFSALFNFDLAFTMLETVKNEKAVAATIHEDAWKVLENGSPADLFQTSTKTFQQYNPDFLNTTFLTNHDQNRVMSFLDNDLDKARLAAAILLTLPGSPYLYYGEEIGMRGAKPDPNIREPFLWSSPKDSCRATWIAAEYSTDETIPSLEAQQADPASIYQLYRHLIHQRRASEALSLGDITTQDMNDEQLLAFTRATATESVLVIHNLSGVQKSVKTGEYTQLLLTSKSTSNTEDGLLLLAPYESVILGK